MSNVAFLIYAQALGFGIKTRRNFIKNNNEDLQEKDKQTRFAEIFPEYLITITFIFEFNYIFIN